MEIRNIAIIAHVDHGKTTLTDAIMRQCGVFETGMSMDTNVLEQERGITIYSKNTAVFYRGTKINIVDTPGHADFSSEVERVLRSIDSVLLVVDAQEGPMPQTRFVLKKALDLGMKPIVVINKIDKPAADPALAEEQILELFLELGASSEQLDFPVVYAIGKNQVAMRKLSDPRVDITPLLDLILEKVLPANNEPSARLRAQTFNLGYDNYLGRLAVIRVYEGRVSAGDDVFILAVNRQPRSGRVAKLFTLKGLEREEVSTVESGDIALVAGLPDIAIGETLSSNVDASILPAIAVDEPTIRLNFLVNNSPFAGHAGKYLTSRQLRERLEKELEINVGLRIDFSQADRFLVEGRGELHIAILLENLRREGYELQVSQPQVIIKEVAGERLEPFEEITIDIPKEFQGTVIKKLSERRAMMKDIRDRGDFTRLIFECPTRSLLGYRNKFLVETRGEGILSTRVIGFRSFAGKIESRATGAMISMITGTVLAYALDNLQTRGTLYIAPGMEVYEGMVVGETNRGDELLVNPVKGKHLTNVRAAGADEAIKLTPPRILTIESGLELMREDEYLEITPREVRLRKQELTEGLRARARRNTS